MKYAKKTATLLVAFLLGFSGWSPAKHENAAPEYEVLWINEFGIDADGLGIFLDTNLDDPTVDQYKSLICRLISELDLQDYREYGVEKASIADYRSLKLNLYYDLDEYVPLIGISDPETTARVIKHTRGSYVYNRGRGGRIGLYYPNRPYPDNNRFFAADHEEFCKKPD